MDRLPALRRLSWSHMTAWSDDTEHNASKGRLRWLSRWRISADCAPFFAFIMDAVVFLSVSWLLNWVPLCASKEFRKKEILFVTCFMLLRNQYCHYAPTSLKWHTPNTTKNSDFDRQGALKFTAALKKHEITLAAKQSNRITLFVCLACFKERYLSGERVILFFNLKWIPTTYI